MGFGEFIFAVIVVGLGLLGISVYRRKKTENVEVNTPPSVDTLGKFRRRRRAGGFYPIGYTGSFLAGEELVAEAVWMAELAALSMAERDALGEYGSDDFYQVEDPRESDGTFDEPVAEVPVEEPVVVNKDEPVVSEPDRLHDAHSDNEPLITEPESTEFEPEEDDSKKSGWGSDFDGDGEVWDFDDPE